MPVTSREATGTTSDPPEHATSAAAAIAVKTVRRIGPSVWAISSAQQADEIQNFGP